MVGGNLFRLLKSFFEIIGGGVRYTLALNFRLEDDYFYVQNDTRYILEQCGKPPVFLQVIEIGNEPDLYVQEGYRNATWNASMYLPHHLLLFLLL